MSGVEQYPQDAYYLVLDVAALQLGSYVTNGGDLTSANLRFYHKKSGSFSYSLTLVGSASLSGPALFSSDVITFSDTAIGQTTDDFLCDVTFDFGGYNLLDGETYYFRLEHTGYTRSGDSSYLSVNCDWLEPIGTGNTGGARMPMGVKL